MTDTNGHYNTEQKLNAAQSKICNCRTNRGAGQSNLGQRIFVYMFVYLCVCNAQECKKYLIQCAGIFHPYNIWT